MGEQRGRAVAAALVAVALAGCGGQRQDADEPEGTFRVEISDASFPSHQTIAQSTRLRISVRNTDRRTLPNVAVTVETRPTRAGAAPIAFGEADSDTRLADPEKPVWIVDAGPKGGETAYTNTWSLGRMLPGQTKEFVWRLTAVKAGTYTIAYRVSPGLAGKAKPARGRTRGSFQVTISDKPVPAHVDEKGNVVRGDETGSGSGSDGL
jgi:hypothetical protein